MCARWIDGRDDGMLGIMLRKLISKKWMFACLFLGCVLLIATVVSFPLYKNAAFDKMLRDEFTMELVETGHWPARFKGVVISERHKNDAALHELEELINGMPDRLHVETKESVLFYRLNNFQITSLMEREDLGALLKLRPGFMSGLPEHVRLLGGEMYSETGLSADGAVEVVINQNCMTSNNLLLGETLLFDSLRDKEGRQLMVRIVGIIEDIEGDYYWEIGAGELGNVLLMNEALFREYFVGRSDDSFIINCTYSYLFDYEKLESRDADVLKAVLDEEPEKFKGKYFGEVLDRFLAKRERISATLFILQVPLLVLLAAFLFMISGQMYELERNEISVIKSRGSSGGQIFRLYIYQSIFLAAVGVLFGVPLGGYFSRILGSASNFLEFGLSRRLETRMTEEVYLYLAAAAAATILIMALPAVRHSRVSIVHLKQKRAAKKKPLWEKLFLDFICVAIALYGWYSYSGNEEQLVRNVLLGESFDPLLYLCSSLFIVGMGLLYLRLQPLLVKLIYLIGQRFWRPASYASFQENLKNGRRQQFIMLFLILTIALGIFHATVARTILQNAQDNTSYIDGVDVILKEKWKTNKFAADDDDDDGIQMKFFEPDSGKYPAAGFIEKYTKVIAAGPCYGNDTAKAVMDMGKDSCDINLLGIHTREFGEETWVDRELLEKPYYAYLNELAEAPGGVLLSRNCQVYYGIKTGSFVTIRYRNSLGKEYVFRGKVLDFVDYWPGYIPSTEKLTEGADNVLTEQNYLAVVNISALQRLSEDVEPYEVWISLREGTDANEVARWINDNKIIVSRYRNRAEDLQADVENPLLQGTNGVLTMGFLVMILLCGVGYLIYWIMSIRSREMMFGVLRAFGMHKSELFHMLMLEQIFSGVLTVFAGIGIGKLVSKLYVPMLQTAYAVSDQVLPMKLSSDPSDMVRLYSALAVVMATCLVVLVVLVVKLNVTKALKLGEE